VMLVSHSVLSLEAANVGEVRLLHKLSRQ